LSNVKKPKATRRRGSFADFVGVLKDVEEFKEKTSVEVQHMIPDLWMEKYRKESIGNPNGLFHRPRPPTPCHPAPAGARAWGQPARPALPALAHALPGRCPRHPAPAAGQRWRPQAGHRPASPGRGPGDGAAARLGLLLKRLIQKLRGAAEARRLRRVRMLGQRARERDWCTRVEACCALL
jgi:hypothetical protein